MSGRYALYFMPADDTALATFGCAVLGRDAAGKPVAPPTPDFIGRESIVARASTYGFHATLKAPFALAAGGDRDTLQDALQDFARRQTPITLTGLAPERLGGFCALVLPSGSAADSAVNTLASHCVTEFESCRAPLSAADVARRNPASLDAVRRDYLERYGYPHVFDAFRFHMTLSGPMPQPEQYLAWLGDGYRRHLFHAPLLDRLALAYQRDRDTVFVRLAEYPLGNG